LDSLHPTDEQCSPTAAPALCGDQHAPGLGHDPGGRDAGRPALLRGQLGAGCQHGDRAALAQAAKGLDNLTQINNLGLAGLIPINLPSLTDSVNTLAGLDQALPGWIAALLSALGAWISLPFAWLQSWLVYGLLVALTAKGLGATMTLQRFYAATGYFAVPLILTNLTVIPYLGGLLGAGISVWALLVYARGVQVVGRLDGLRVVASLVIPLLALAMIYMAFALTMGFASGILLS